MAFLNCVEAEQRNDIGDYIIFCGHRKYAHNDEVVDFYSQSLSDISTFLKKKIVLVSLHGGKGGDELFHEKIKTRLGDMASCVTYGGGDIHSLSSLFASSFFVISMRLHGLIFAELLMKPSIGIAYSEKVRYFLEKTNNFGSLVSCGVPNYNINNQLQLFLNVQVARR